METSNKHLQYLKNILLFLVFFDLAIALPALFAPEWIINVGKLNSDQVAGAMYRAGAIEPIFMRGIGILWLIAAYVQYLAWQDPRRRLQCVNVAIVFRFAGGTFELIEAAYLLPQAGFGDPLIYWVLGVFVAGDYLLIAAMAYLLHKLGFKWWELED